MSTLSTLVIEPGKTQLGWIGTGVMGVSMAEHLMKAGFSLTVYSRTKSKAKSLLESGAQWAKSPQAVAQQSDVVFSIVGFPNDVREVLLGENGALSGSEAGMVLIDMTTSQPALAIEIDQAARKKGVHAIDAPVSGGDVGAKNGTLSIMMGGDAAIIESLQPCWEAMGKTIVRQGDAGAGQHTKMVNQTLIASGMIGVCEALLYGHQAGLDLGPRIIANNFDPGFFVEHFIKDMGIALEEAKRMKLSLPGLAMAHQLYLAVQAAGDGRKGTHALQIALAKLANVDWVNRQ